MANTTIPSELIADGAITSAKLDTNIAVGGTLTVTGDANFDSDTLFVDVSANNVGLGITSPSAQLHLSRGGGTLIKLGTSQNTSEIEARESGNANSLVFSSNNSTDHLVIDPNGNVGINTSSPSNYYSGADNLVVYQATGLVGMTIATGDSSVGALYFADGTTGVDAYKGGMAYSHSTDVFKLVSGGAAKINIDATGHTYPEVNASWDLGKTNNRFKDLYLSGTASVGHVIPNTAGTYSINHLGVYSGGITVNAATSQTGYLMSAGTGIVGFGPNGGSIRLGGTTAANELDDYEEGTFTPSYTVGGGGSVTGVTSTNVGAYTKVGRMCTVTVRSFYVATSGTIPTYYRVTLPFTAATITNGMTGGGFGQETGQSGAGMMIKVDSGQTSAIIWKYDGTPVPANSYFELMFTYMTA
jgi:hypothetical protein